jgi:hypothetical protein
MEYLVATAIHIPPLLGQYTLNAQSSHSATEFPETADTVILLVNLDASNHSSPTVSIAG